MKRLTGILLSVLLLAGCANDDQLDRAASARSKFQSNTCRFRATVTADYGDTLQTFVLDCEEDRQGTLRFAVAAPDTIAGISGTLEEDSGFLTFDGEILAIELVADGQLSPVSAPWVILNALRSGYLRYCAESDGGLRLTVDDSYGEDPLQVELWLEEDQPTGAEILWRGRRILSLRIENFAFLEQQSDPGIG